MEVDTGASVSIVSKDHFKKLQDNGTTLRPTGAMLSTYTGESISVKGATEVTVKYNGQIATPLLPAARDHRYSAATGCLR